MALSIQVEAIPNPQVSLEGPLELPESMAVVGSVYFCVFELLHRALSDHGYALRYNFQNGKVVVLHSRELSVLELDEFIPYAKINKLFSEIYPVFEKEQYWRIDQFSRNAAVSDWEFHLWVNQEVAPLVKPLGFQFFSHATFIRTQDGLNLIL